MYGFIAWDDRDETRFEAEADAMAFAESFYEPTDQDWSQMAADLATLDALAAESALHDAERYGTAFGDWPGEDEQ